MINNNPYNIPERPQKQRKVFIQNPPLYPHQLNRAIEEPQHKQRAFLHKRPTNAYLLESSVSDISRIPTNTNQLNSSTTLQMSNVSQWSPFPNTPHPHMLDEFNEKITHLNAKVEAHERKLYFLMDQKKQEVPASHLSESTSHSQDSPISMVSRQMERYHSTEQPWDKLREQFSTYRSQSQKLGQNLRAQLHQQRDSITQQIILSFKECLKEKFQSEEVKISEYLSDFEHQLCEIKKMVKTQVETLSGKLAQQFMQAKAVGGDQFKEKLMQLTSLVEDFQSDYKNFKEEVFDNVLATQDHKRWLYELDNKIGEVKGRYNMALPGSLNISQDYCQGEVMHINFEQYFKIQEKSTGHSIKGQQRTYMIDHQGYLLDFNHYYIIDTKGQRIKLSEQDISKLKQHKLL